MERLDLDIRRGEIFGLLGPNGSGKTTTIRMLCGLLEPTSGSAIVAGFDVAERPDDVKQNIGYMSQRYGLYDELTVYENIRFYASVYGLRGSVRADRIRELGAQLGLDARMGQAAGTLSGGWKQRLALACATAHRPPVLFLDEPTAGVDPASRRRFWKRIHELARDGITILVTTHYMDEASQCMRLGFLSRGHLIALGTPEEIRDSSARRRWRTCSWNCRRATRRAPPRRRRWRVAPGRTGTDMGRRQIFPGFLPMLWKEFVQMRRDRFTLAMMVGIPAVQLALFGYAIRTEVRDLPMVVLDQARTPESRALATTLRNTGNFRIIGEVRDRDELRQAIERGVAHAALVIPPDFSRDLARHRGATAQVIVDAADPLSSTAAINGAALVGATLASAGDAGLRGRPEVRVRPWYNPGLKSSTYIVPGIIGVLLSITLIVITSMAIVRERERGTLEQLIVTPISKASLMLGKIVPFILVGYVQMTVCSASANCSSISRSGATCRCCTASRWATSWPTSRSACSCRPSRRRRRRRCS